MILAVNFVSMRIAIIGGGAAGLATAYYLSEAGDHELVLYEKQASLGGNVRTLGLNTQGPPALEALNIDNGVIEFPANSNPRLSALLAELGVPTQMIQGGSTSLFTEKNGSFHMPSAISRMPDFSARLPRYLKLMQAILGFAPGYFRSRKADPEAPVNAYLGDDMMSRWLKGLMMYAFSMPYTRIGQFPIGFARETLIRMVNDRRWMRIEGGVYRYMQAILSRCPIEVHCGAESLQLERTENGLVIDGGGKATQFDLAVLAVPPHEVLNIISSPGDGERASFSVWQENVAETIIHTDTSIYDRWQPPEYTEFDIFEKNEGGDAGYNAYLNRLVGVAETEPHYFMAFNLEDRIDPEKILHRWRHNTTLFQSTNDTRADIRALSGIDRVFFAGAYLYDGLHEGAIESAWQVARAVSLRAPA